MAQFDGSQYFYLLPLTLSLSQSISGCAFFPLSSLAPLPLASCFLATVACTQTRAAGNILSLYKYPCQHQDMEKGMFFILLT
jgi:hypothetical protein